jgi:hypothetical protein
MCNGTFGPISCKIEAMKALCLAVHYLTTKDVPHINTWIVHIVWAQYSITNWRLLNTFKGSWVLTLFGRYFCNCCNIRVHVTMLAYRE